MPVKKKFEMRKKINIRESASRQYLLEIEALLNNDPNIMNRIESMQSQQEYQRIQDVLIKIQEMDGHGSINKNHYQKLYTEFQMALEDVAKLEIVNGLSGSNLLDPLYIQAYENNNKIHEKIYEDIIEDDEKSSRLHVADESKLKSRLEERNVDPYSQSDPRHPNNKANDVFSSGLGIAYHPFIKNNTPYVAYESVRLSTSRDAGSRPTAKCLRMGAQTQGADTINPTFQRYLLAKERAEGSKANLPKNGLNDSPYDFLYFCLLKTNPSGTLKLSSRYSEGKRSLALHRLEETNKNIAVVNLPADGYFFQKGMHHGQPYEEVKIESLGELLGSVVESIEQNKNDFNISTAVKNKVFPPSGSSQIIIENLFKKSVKEVLGKDFDLARQVTAEERNAILFQFIKFNLTQHILEKLSPNAYTIVCKDGIDRGGIHTLWFHMSLQYTQNNPMGKDEFLKHLDAPAMLVKGRPLNHNRDFLWNVLSQRMQNDTAFRNAHLWAEQWLKNNQPISCKPYILGKLDRTIDFLTDRNESASTPDRDAKPMVNPREQPFTNIRAEEVISNEQWNKAIGEIVKHVKGKSSTIPEEKAITIDPENQKVHDRVHQINIEKKSNSFDVSSQKPTPEIEVMVAHYKSLARETGIDYCVIDSSPSPETTAKIILHLLSDPLPSIRPVIEDDKILKSLKQSKSVVCQNALSEFVKAAESKSSVKNRHN